jgi:flagellar hook-associated protein 2
VNADANMVAFGKKVSVAWNGAGFDFGSATIGSGSSVSIDTIADDLKTRLGLGDPAAVNGTDAQGKINGIAMQGIGEKLLAPATSPAVGLVLHVATGATSATISVGGGITGAMKDIYTSLATGEGALASALARITKEQTAITKESAKIDTRSETLKTSLTKQFAAMEAAVAAFKSTQDFLQQQIDAWNADN